MKRILKCIEPGYSYKDDDGNEYTMYGEFIEDDHTEINYHYEFIGEITDNIDNDIEIDDEEEVGDDDWLEEDDD